MGELIGVKESVMLSPRESVRRIWGNDVMIGVGGGVR